MAAWCCWSGVACPERIAPPCLPAHPQPVLLTPLMLQRPRGGRAQAGTLTLSRPAPPQQVRKRGAPQGIKRGGCRAAQPRRQRGNPGRRCSALRPSAAEHTLLHLTLCHPRPPATLLTPALCQPSTCPVPPILPRSPNARSSHSAICRDRDYERRGSGKRERDERYDDGDRDRRYSSSAKRPRERDL